MRISISMLFEFICMVNARFALLQFANSQFADYPSPYYYTDTVLTFSPENNHVRHHGRLCPQSQISYTLHIYDKFRLFIFTVYI